jgi:hypothetical protein
MNFRAALAMSALLVNFALFRAPDSPQIQSSEDQDDIFVRSFVIPPYPPISRTAYIQGDITAVIHIRADGTVDSISDVEGPPLLRQTTVEGLKQWSFFTKNKETDLKITFRWKLEGPGSQYPICRVSGRFPHEVEIVMNPPAPLGPDSIEAPN